MHKSVLLQETIEWLKPKSGNVFIDITLGAGGHTCAILDIVGENGKVLAVDKDESAIALVAKSLGNKQNVKLVHGDFREIAEIAKNYGVKGVDGIVADLGVSSMQLDSQDRGFSFSKHSLIDMRMNAKDSLTASEIVNTYSEEELKRIFREYGEEKLAARIAKAIVQERVNSQFKWTDQLAEVVRRVKRGIRNTKIDPATKIFQALRIETNEELKALESALPQVVGLLRPGGRVGIISFHSLEDRIVKRFFEKEAKRCVCPPDSPICNCAKKATLKVLTKHPVVSGEEELRANPRARSAKLRVAEKI